MKSVTQRGFTLIELLVAISILAIVAVLGWRGLDSIVRARVALTSELESTRGLQLAFAQMQSDVGHVVPAVDIGNRTTLAAQPGRLTLVRTVFADDQPSRVQVITYRVLNGVLTRRESIATRDLKELDVAWSAAISDSDVVVPAVTLHSGVREMAIRLWDTGIGWRTSGTTAAPNPVVRGAEAIVSSGVEVSLQLFDRPAHMVKVFLVGPA